MKMKKLNIKLLQCLNLNSIMDQNYHSEKNLKQFHIEF